MPRYLFTHILSILLSIIGWAIATLGTYSCYAYLNKPKIMALLPAHVKEHLLSVPDWLFYLPAGVSLVIGLIILGIGHTMIMAVENARIGLDTGHY